MRYPWVEPARVIATLSSTPQALTRLQCRQESGIFDYLILCSVPLGRPGLITMPLAAG
jgi:hypothetical protein